jgi:hypothetical protein
VVSGEGIKMDWEIKYLYDGECSMCLTLKVRGDRSLDRSRGCRVGQRGSSQQAAAPGCAPSLTATPTPHPRNTAPPPQAVLGRNDKDNKIKFVDIADMDYDPMANMGVVRLDFGLGLDLDLDLGPVGCGRLDLIVMK